MTVTSNPMEAGSPPSNVFKAHPPGSVQRTPGGSWLANQGRLPLAFMGLALAWLVAGTAMLVARPGLLALPHAHLHVVALTHAWLLGVFVTVACGAVYQLAPVALGTTLWSERYAWWHFGLHAVGVPGMVWTFWHWNLAQLGHFGLLVAIGAGLFSANIWRTVSRSQRTGLVASSLRLSALWLVLTVTFGLILAANRFWYFIPLDPLPLLRAHAHLGLAGFFVTLLQGVTFQLVPMFTLGEVRDWRLASRGFWISQAALAGLIPALLMGAAWAETGFGAAFIFGGGCSAVALRRALATRKKRSLDPGVIAFLGGGLVLLGAAGTGLALVWPGAPWGSASGGLSAMVYGVLVVLGGLLPCLSGMMGKIVPFLTWMRAYGPRVGRMPTPAASTLAAPWLERAGLGLQFVAVAPLLVGAWRVSEAWLAAGAWLLAAGVGFFVANQIWVLRHLWLAEATVAGKKPGVSP